MRTVTEEDDLFTSMLMLRVVDNLRDQAQNDNLALEVLRLLAQVTVQVFRLHSDQDDGYMSSDCDSVYPLISGPREVLNQWKEETSAFARENLLDDIFKKAFDEMAKFDIRKREMMGVTFSTDWKVWLAELADITDPRDFNQGVNVPTAIMWNNLVLGSPPERPIAEALERAGVLFFTNSPAQLGPKNARERRYPDFVVCHKGKWGILEVDSLTYHKPQNKAQDNAKDELYYYHEIKVVRRYLAGDCTRDPDAVVKRFLEQLEKMG